MAQSQPTATKSTPEQRLQFSFFLINRAGFDGTAVLGQSRLENKNWLGIYDIVEALSKPQGPLVQTEPLVPQDIIHEMRLALNELVLKRLENDINESVPQTSDSPPEPVEEQQMPTEFVNDEEDDGLQPA